MKLRNKKTGEIVKNAYVRETEDFYRNNKRTIAVFTRDKNRPPERASVGYNSLAQLNEEWEDAPEEPKEYWAIDCFSPDGELVSQFGKCSEKITENRKQIGNYFESEEEAEKAVERLRAWKRLEDKGLSFKHWKEAPLRFHSSCIAITGNMNCDEEAREDLDLLFGGEE